MFEKVNPCHPDKVADRIGGAIVDLCYTKSVNPKVACEVLIGDENVTFQYADGKTETESFADVVEKARRYIMTDCGGFEKFSEWGLIRPRI